MSLKKVMIFAVIMAALAAFVMLWELPQRKTKAEEKMTGDKISGLDFDAVDKIELERGEEKLAFSLQGEIWRMAAPVDDQAEQWTVKALVSAIRYAHPSRKIDQLPENYAQLFGLDNPRQKLTLTVAEKSETYLIGNTHQIGNSVYLKPADKNVVYLVAESSLSALGKPLLDFRRRELLVPENTELKVSSLQIIPAKGDSILLLAKTPPKSENEAEAVAPLPEDLTWKINAPDGPTADAEAVKNLLDKLATVRATEFLENITDDLPAQYELDKPWLTLIATYNDGESKVTKKLIVGKKKELSALYYAIADGRPFLLNVHQEEIAPFQIARADLRDRRLLPDLIPEKVAMIDLQTTGGSFRLARSGEGWVFADEKPADGESVERLLAAAVKWRADKLVDGLRAAKLTMAQRKNKALTLTLLDANGAKIESLDFSGPLVVSQIAPETPPVKPEPGQTPPEQVVVTTTGGFAGTVYLVEKQVLDEIPTVKASLEARPQPAADAPENAGEGELHQNEASPLEAE